jgi:hypothetical protein
MIFGGQAMTMVKTNGVARLEFFLAMDFVHAVSPGQIPDSRLIDQTLAPYLDAIRKDVGILERPAGALAEELGIDEAIIRQAQALMRHGDGRVSVCRVVESPK